MPGYPSGDNSGYISSISVPSTTGNHTITIKAIGNDGSTSSSNVTINVTALDLSSKVVSYAKKFIGVPYVYGGTTPAGFDCSGFVQYVYGHNGAYQVQLPRTTYDQVNVGTPIAKSDMKPGDLVFFGSQVSPYHVGIYIGSDQFIEAPKTGCNVRVSALSVRPDFCAARRIIQ
jgi:cell wall-associated NlpC family hydrolase